MQPGVAPGIEVLLADSLHLVRGKRVGLITNHSGRDRRGTSTIDLLYHAPGVRLTALFGPEHGLARRRPRPARRSRRRSTRRPACRSTRSTGRRMRRRPRCCATSTCSSTTFRTSARASTPTSGRWRSSPKPRRKSGRSSSCSTGPIRFAAIASRAASSSRTIPLVRRAVPSCLALRPHAGRAAALSRRHRAGAARTSPWCRCAAGARSMWWEETGIPWVNPSPNLRSMDATVAVPGHRLLRGDERDRGSRHRQAVPAGRRGMAERRGCDRARDERAGTSRRPLRLDVAHHRAAASSSAGRRFR